MAPAGRRGGHPHLRRRILGRQPRLELIAQGTEAGAIAQAQCAMSIGTVLQAGLGRREAVLAGRAAAGRDRWLSCRSAGQPPLAVAVHAPRDTPFGSL